MKRKILLNLIIMFLLIISLVSFVGAEFWACFNYREIINYCPYKADETCSQEMGCVRCMSKYYEEKYPEDLNCYVHGNNNKCIRLPQECSSFGANTTIDSKPPELTINSPKEGIVYPSRSVLLDFVLDENADVYYYDNINRRGRWTRVCSDCHIYSGARSFNEGLNDLTFRAADPIGNTAYVNRSFYVDSQKPKIHNTKPENGEYTNGEFSVEYTEENIKNITLYYQKESESLQTITKTDCSSGKKQICNFDLELEGEFSLEYYFGVSDSAQTIFSSKKTVYVDTITPQLDVFSPHNPSLVYNNKKVLINTSVSESVLLEYIDYSDRTPRWKKICSDCSSYLGTETFVDGQHDVDFRAMDNAGNYDITERDFIVDTKKPKINKAEPTSGFADGNFYVEFTEENPFSLVLNYGNIISGFGKYNYNIGEECFIDKKKNICSAYVDLSIYDNETILYWANLTDIGGNYAESKKANLKVDVSDPIIDYINYPINRNYVNFEIGITEPNFEEVLYKDYLETNKPTWKRLCSRLVNGICKARKSFRKGQHSIGIQVIDQAGNSVSGDKNLKFEI